MQQNDSLRAARAGEGVKLRHLPQHPPTLPTPQHTHACRSAFRWFRVGYARESDRAARARFQARTLNGIGVGMVSPLLFSIIADTTAEADRGKAFGVFALFQSCGATIGGFCSTVISGHG